MSTWKQRLNKKEFGQIVLRDTPLRMNEGSDYCCEDQIG